ncbi:Fur family transcriptional regulator [Maridesulfovibrio hydrothermalis]|uniref:Ferric uptake regulation protein n=1 Tax=Maridesulfovibrio hydrothermalis AM13 = DSM 14728 TaxID=1121451 RepID=L0RBY0_9BACT|nr:Fur family transcriptional regulator [Maridesulfovibrio hydrothermalis]CCO23056.1 Ferric uptake regulator, Fur family [Maridesulfovibrio hydrothermalis AM13 = DSM 14728]
MKAAQDIFTEYLSKQRLKMTPQRRTILDVFLNEEGHISSEELYNLIRKEDSSIGQATVYRTLKLLAESGIAKTVDFNDGVIRYEHKYGHEHHDHLVCECCGKTIEAVDHEIEHLQKELAKKHGFVLTHHEMYLFGVCKECQEKSE